MTEATPYREPYVFSFRRPGRSFLARLVAQLVIRLLIIAPLPGQWQAAAALFPASMLWPLVQAAPVAGEAKTPCKEIVWPDNLLKEVTLPSGVKATHSYDKADRLTMLLNANGASVLSSYAYPLYDRNGNRLRQVEKNGGTTETTAYTYDDLNRLETVTYPSDATSYPNGRKVTYAYDQVGNRTQETETNTAGTVLSNKVGVFDNLNRLTSLTDSVTGEATGFTWDNNGNQITKTKAGVTTSYHYDVRDKLVEVGQGASILGRFQYDFEGRRNVKIGEFGTEQYVYDGTSTFLEYDQDGTLKAKYDYGSDRLIGVSRAAGSLFERRYYSFDALRSVTNLSDTSGAVKASYHLDAWGNFRFPQELNADGDTVAAKNRFAFTGYLWDKETNLFFAKARFYDPEVGRFISQDSELGQVDDPPSLHRYFYGNDNPTRYVDPTGGAVIESEDLYTNELLIRIREYNPSDGTVHHETTCGGLGGGDMTCIRPVQPDVRLQAILAQAGGDKEKAYQAVLAMKNAGQRSAAGIQIEESDLTSGGQLDKAKLFNQFIGKVGTYAGSLRGLREEFYAAIEGAKRGEARDISFLYNLAYEYSAVKAYQAADEDAKKHFGPDFIQRNAHLLGQYGAAPPDVSLEAGAALAMDTVGAASLGLGIYRVGAALVGAGGEAAEAATTALVPRGTRTLGEWGEARLAQVLEGAGTKPSKPFTTSLGRRYVDRLVNGVAHEAKAGIDVGLTSSIETQIAKDAELIASGRIRGAHWHFFQGAKPELLRELTRNGIQYTVY